MPTLIDRISSIADQSKRAAVETALFGESGRKLDGLLAGGNQKVSDLAEALQRTGAVLSSSDIAKLNDTAKKLEEVKAQLQVDLAQVVAGNAATIERLAAAFSRLANSIPNALALLDRFQQRAGIVEGYLNVAVGTATGRQGQIANGAREVADSSNRLSNLQADAKEREIQRLTAGYPSVADQLRQIGVQPGKVNTGLLNSLNAPKGRKGPNPNTALNEADERTKRFNDAMARYQDEILAATAQQTSDEEARRDIQREQLRRDEARQIGDGTINGDGDLQRQAAIDRRNAPKDAARINDRLQQQIKKVQEVTAEKLDKINLDSTLSALTRQNDADNAILEFKNQQLQAQESLARTAEERRDLELQILANEQQIAKNNANLVFNRKAEGDPTITRADVNSAQRTLDNLPADTASKAAVIDRQTQGPLESYLDALPRSASLIKEQFEQAAVSGVERLNDSLDHSITKMLHLHGVAGEFLSDLIKIGLHALEGNLFGGSGSGGGLGGLFGGIGKFFGAGDAGSTLSAASFDALPGLAGGGTIDIGGRGGIDRNLLSLNGRAVARVNMGEQIHVVNPNQRVSSGGPQYTVIAPQHFDLSNAVMTPDLVNQLTQSNRAYADAVGKAAYSNAVGTSGRQAPGIVQKTQTLKG